MNVLQRAVKALSQMVFPSYGGNNWIYVPRVTDYDVTLSDSSLVMAIVYWICRTLPEAPLQVVKMNTKGEREIIQNHGLPELLETPNPFYSGLLLWNGIFTDWIIEGNAYVLKVRNGAGAVIQLWWIPESMMEPQWDKNGGGFIDYYEYQVDGKLIRYDPKDVIHFRFGIDPYNPRKGLSPLRSLIREVYTDEEAAAFSATLLANMGVPGFIISPEGDGINSPVIDQRDAEAVKQQFWNATKGARRGEPLVLNNQMKITTLSFNPQQMNLKDLRRLPEERVSAVLGIPAVVVGFGAGLDRSTFANFSEAREAAYESFVIPTQRLFASDLKTQLLPDFGETKGLKVEHDNSNVRVLQEDENKKAERIRGLFKDGIIMRSKALSELGYPTATDGSDDIFLIPMALIPMGPGAPEPEPLPEPSVSVEKPPAQLTDSEKRRRRFVETKAYGRVVQRIEQRATNATKAYLDKQYERAAAALENEKARQLPLDFGDEIAGLWNRFYPLIIAQSWDDVVDEIGTELAFDLENIYVQEVLGELAKKVRQVAETTKDEIRRLVGLQAENGWSVDDLAKEIRALKETHSRARARTIARTETGTAYNLGSLAGYQEAGVKRVEVFDGDDDEPCASANGAIWTIEEAQANPLGHPNCVRAFAAVVE